MIKSIHVHMYIPDLQATLHGDHVILSNTEVELCFLRDGYDS